MAKTFVHVSKLTILKWYCGPNRNRIRTEFDTHSIYFEFCLGSDSSSMRACSVRVRPTKKRFPFPHCIYCGNFEFSSRPNRTEANLTEPNPNRTEAELKPKFEFVPELKPERIRVRFEFWFGFWSIRYKIWFDSVRFIFVRSWRNFHSIHFLENTIFFS